jgi:hypothetical protein
MKRATIAFAATLFATSAIAHDLAVPAGHSLAMTALGAGDLTYECKARPNMADAWEWVFAGPNAVLYDKASNKPIGKYYGGPTWEADDGSKVTGKQLAVSPSPNAASIPLQLVQAAPSMGTGAMSGITYIQRMNTKGGIAPADTCGAANVGMKKTVKYEADYLFFKAS